MNDPYNDRKKYHMAALMSNKGDVSPLCGKKPRKLNLKKELWTLEEGAVTCKKCLELLK